MASTNSTTHYELSQYIGTDKPTYLVDYNQDMSKIDTGIYGAKSKADNNETSIGTLTNLQTTEKSNLVGAVNEVNTNSTNNSTNIGTLSSLSTTEKSNLVGAVNEVKTEADGNKTNIGTMANLSTTDKSSLVGAVNEVKSEANTNKANIENFNLTSYTTIDPNDYDVTTGTTGSFGTWKTIKVAKNNDGSLAKVYGKVSYNPTSQNTGIIIHNSGLAPTSDITINMAGICRVANQPAFSPVDLDLIIRTNGDLEISPKAFGPDVSLTFYLFPCLYFIKDFGDIPTPQI